MEYRKVFLLVGLMMCVVWGMAQEVRKVKIGEVAEYVKKSDHPVVVSFWATWCGPCVEEIPYLQKAVEDHKSDSVEFVLVSLDFGTYYPKKITDFIKQKNYKATFFWLDETNADLFCPVIDKRWDGTIPVTLMINNKTGYRRFFDRQLTDRQVGPEIKLLVAPKS